jgi:iron(III) transport system substrate-binding protein
VAETANSWDDVLDPSVNGKIGMRPNVDTMLAGHLQYFEGKNGPDFPPRVAAQNPKLDPSVIPVTLAVGSGEIGVAIMSARATIKDLQDQGPSIDYWLPENSCAGGFYAAILKKSKRQEAAQAVLDYFMSPEGQAASRGAGATEARWTPPWMQSTGRRWRCWTPRRRRRP